MVLFLKYLRFMAFTNNSSNVFSSLPSVTKHLLIINLLCWIAPVALSKINIDVYALFSLHYLGASSFAPYQLITYMFLHAPFPSLSHIFFNMFALFMFGQVIERSWGPKFFIVFYFSTGIGAGLIQELTWMYEVSPALSYVNQVMNQPFPLIFEGVRFDSVDQLHAYVDMHLGLRQTVGASGAIFGLLTAFAMLFPNQPIYFMFIPIPIKAKYFMIVYAVIELLLGVHHTGDGIAHFAHLGGALVGFILVLLWKKHRTFNRY